MFQQVLIRFLAVIGLLAGMTVKSCASPQDEGANRSEPDFVGFITIIEPGSGRGEEIGKIVVESHANKLVRRHVVKVTKKTAVLQADGKTDRRVNFDSLETKAWVRVWFADSTTRPYPLQVTARQLMIVDRP